MKGLGWLVGIVAAGVVGGAALWGIFQWAYGVDTVLGNVLVVTVVCGPVLYVLAVIAVHAAWRAWTGRGGRR